MPGVELDAPDIDDVDDEAPTYKRLVALVVVLITLFGSGVAYLQSVQSNREDVAARDAQRSAVAGLGSRVDANASAASDLRIASELDAQLQREVLNAGRINRLGGDESIDVHQAAAERFAAARAAVAGLTPIDPRDLTSAVEEIGRANVSVDAARLRQVVQATQASEHGGKADSYVAVLTVLAVSLFLLGLSLTVQGGTRYVLAAPGVVIALVCVGWTGLIASQDVTEVRSRALRATAEGQRLQSLGDFDGAIEAYSEAIAESPGFAVAFARRADARFAQGSSQIGQTGFISITSPEALEDALDDTERALELGAADDIVTLADAAFLFFLDRDFDRSAELSEQALELNESLGQVWFNLGVAEVAQGNERAATRAYREGRQALAEAADPSTRSQVLAGARTDLSVLRDLLDDDDLDDVLGLIEQVEGELAAFEASFTELPCDAEPCPTPEDLSDDAELGELTLTTTGAFVFGDYAVEGAEAGTPITTVWYVRTDDDAPFEQTALSVETSRAGADGAVTSATLASANPPCPLPGEYLVRAYAGERFLGEVRATLQPGSIEGPFELVTDAVEGYEACVPEEFEVSRAEVTEIDSFTSFTGEDIVISLNVTPGIVANGTDPEEFTLAVLSGFLGVDRGELLPIVFSGIAVDGAPVQIPGFVGTSADGSVTAAFAAGPDESSRNLLITGTVDLDFVQDVTELITFTGVSVE